MNLLVVTYNDRPIKVVEESEESRRKLYEYVKKRIAEEFPAAVKWESEERGFIQSFPHTPFKVHSQLWLEKM